MRFSKEETKVLLCSPYEDDYGPEADDPDYRVCVGAAILYPIRLFAPGYKYYYRVSLSGGFINEGGDCTPGTFGGLVW